MRRREFLADASLASALMLVGGCSTVEENIESIADAVERSKKRRCKFNMCNYAAPKIEKLRVGLVGIGSRGTTHLKLWTKVDGVEITALCDVRKKAVEDAQKYLESVKKPKALEFYGAPESWRALCESENVDLVVNAAPWEWHVPVSVYAMECGKHTAVEVQAATTLEGCWKLVETSERTRRHCIQMENCCYDNFELATIQMAKDGVLGELVGGEGAYIHDVVSNYDNRLKWFDGALWRYFEQLKNNGNLYPTHGLGPLAWAFGVNRGDAFDYMSSMQSGDFTLRGFSEKHAAKHPELSIPEGVAPCGNSNTTLIRTKNGRLLTIFYDVSTVRSYDRKHIISGTKGFVQKYPLPAKMSFSHKFLPDGECAEILKKHEPELLRFAGRAAKRGGGHGGMDYLMIWRIADCLRNGLAPDFDVYDAAAWSSIFPLSIWSVANRSNSIDIPDFTCGNWRVNRPVDLSLRGGGSTKFLV